MFRRPCRDHDGRNKVVVTATTQRSERLICGLGHFDLEILPLFVQCCGIPQRLCRGESAPLQQDLQRRDQHFFGTFQPMRSA
jgi:hypothetical protein